MRTEIIAEIGQNHNGDMALACDMIHAAKANGADAVKFQLYDAKSLFPKDNNPWFDYNCKTELSRADVELLANECSGAGIEFLASVFDTRRVQWLEDVKVLRHKVASRSVCDKDLIKRLCATGKPLIVSLGMWNDKAFPKIDTRAQVDFMYCVSKYPTLLKDLRAAEMDFSRYSGFSDHTVGISAALFAIARGARIIEKHFTLDKKMYGPDHEGSMTPEELRAIHSFRLDMKEMG